MANVENLYNSNGDLMYPLTHQKAVIDDRGNPLDSVLTSINEDIATETQRAEQAENFLQVGIDGAVAAIGELNLTTEQSVDGLKVALNKKTGTKSEVKVPVYDMQNPSATSVGLVDEIFVEDMKAEAKKMVNAEAERAQSAEQMLTQQVDGNFGAFSELGMSESVKGDGYEIALTKKTNTAEKTKVKVPVYDMQNPSATSVGLVDEIFVEDMKAEAKKMVNAEAERAQSAEQKNSDSIEHLDLLVCDTMLNVDGVEFRGSNKGWDYMRSVFFAINTGEVTHYDVSGPFYISPYIVVKGLNSIHVKMRIVSNTAFCVFYDEKKNVISVINSEGSIDIDKDIEIPSDAFYCRLCGNINHIPLQVSVTGSSYKEYVRAIIHELNESIITEISSISIEKNADSTLRYDQSDENPLSSIKETAGLTAIFHDICFIGDSLSSGINYDPYGFEGSNIFTAYPFSWCQRLVALIGNANGANYSVGGWTTRSWISNVWNNEQSSRYTTNGKEEYFKTDKKQCYFICLGTNDNSQNIPTGSVDTDINMSDFSKNADTFAGNYGGIIQRIKSVQPSAKIFVITIPKYFSATAEDNGYNTVIRDISKKFGNVFLLDVQKYSPDVTDLYRYGGHLDTPGYQWFAYLIATYVDYIIRANERKFRYVSIIGTEHDKGDL